MIPHPMEESILNNGKFIEQHFGPECLFHWFFGIVIVDESKIETFQRHIIQCEYSRAYVYFASSLLCVCFLFLRVLYRMKLIWLNIGDSSTNLCLGYGTQVIVKTYWPLICTQIELSQSICTDAKLRWRSRKKAMIQRRKCKKKIMERKVAYEFIRSFIARSWFST